MNKSVVSRCAELMSKMESRVTMAIRPPIKMTLASVAERRKVTMLTDLESVSNCWQQRMKYGESGEVLFLLHWHFSCRLM